MWRISSCTAAGTRSPDPGPGPAARNREPGAARRPSGGAPGAEV